MATKPAKITQRVARSIRQRVAKQAAARETKTRRVQLLIRPSVWAAVETAAAAAGLSANAWTENVLAAVASPVEKAT